MFERNIFIFSYLCAGINFTDIANLKPENIVTGRLQYTRQKTGKMISIQLTKEAISIISRYELQSNSRGYLFPILDERVHITSVQKQNREHKILSKINKQLKEIARILGIDALLTTYSARQTFSTVLKNAGVNVALISETPGHSDLAATKVYLDSLMDEQIDAAMKNLLQSIAQPVGPLYHCCYRKECLLQL